MSNLAHEHDAPVVELVMYPPPNPGPGLGGVHAADRGVSSSGQGLEYLDDAEGSLDP